MAPDGLDEYYIRLLKQALSGRGCTFHSHQQKLDAYCVTKLEQLVGKQEKLGAYNF